MIIKYIPIIIYRLYKELKATNNFSFKLDRVNNKDNRDILIKGKGKDNNNNISLLNYFLEKNKISLDNIEVRELPNQEIVVKIKF
jgi:hypothetical protein